MVVSIVQKSDLGLVDNWIVKIKNFAISSY